LNGPRLEAACGSQNPSSGGSTLIKKDSQVKIHYTLKVDGEVIDSTEGKDPLSYVQGSAEIVPGLEEELEGMKTGDKKAVSISPEKGFGQPNPDAFQKVARKAFNDTENLEEGEWVFGDMGGQKFRAKIVDVGDEEVTLDLNHPLAGKTLEFSIEVVEVL
jgi:FKBP-type peptidyl-prolyl cis-trans isomerase SlyD